MAIRAALAKEAEFVPFHAENGKPVEATNAYEQVRGCGLLVANVVNQYVQFSYDPVAEFLAAWHLLSTRDREGTDKLVLEIETKEPSTPLRTALAEMKRLLPADPASTDA